MSRFVCYIHIVRHLPLVKIFMVICLMRRSTFSPHPQGTAAGQNMNVPVETHIVSDLTEDEYFNFSVRMHATYLLQRTGVIVPIPTNLRCVQFQNGEQKESGLWKQLFRNLPHLLLLLLCNHSCALHEHANGVSSPCWSQTVEQNAGVTLLYMYVHTSIFLVHAQVYLVQACMGS